MKKITFLIIAIYILINTSCTKPIDKTLSVENFPEVKQQISTDENFSKMKSNYIIDKLTEEIAFIELGNKMAEETGQKMDNSTLPIFRNEIAHLSTEFDSIRQSKIEIKENNQKLQNFIELIDAKTISIDKYKGYLTMKLKFNNQFEKEVLYIVMNYKYINKYDSKFFDEKTKLTEEVAGDFKQEVEISTNEKYNNVAEFMYTNVPIRASKSLRDELGEKKANEKVERDFLMEGLKVETLLVVFKDKSQLSVQNNEWKYFED